jgi:hypothetical protein
MCCREWREPCEYPSRRHAQRPVMEERSVLYSIDMSDRRFTPVPISVRMLRRKFLGHAVPHAVIVCTSHPHTFVFHLKDIDKQLYSA